MSNLFYEHLEKQSDGTYLREQYEQGYKDGYAKAIDDFAENCTLKISESLIWGMLPVDCKDRVAEEITEYVLDVVREIAEQLRGGVE